MKVNPDIFKSYDIRGRVGTELTPEVSEKIGKAFAKWLPKAGPVAVGHDMRPDSGVLHKAFIAGVVSQGRDVFDIGLITTDMHYFAAANYHLAGASMVTASHNPGHDNGIKMCADQAKSIGLENGLDAIRDLVIQDSFEDTNGKGRVTKKDIDEDWVEHVLTFIDVKKLKPLRLAVDAGNGMAGKIFPKLERHLPFKVKNMYFELDGTFPNHIANPLKFETLDDIRKVIKEDGLDGGVAFDGDGDRAFLIDELGEIVSGAVMTSILAEHFLKQKPGEKIVYDIRNSQSVPTLISKLGGQPVLCRVGHSPLKKKMREEKALFGGEASGHFFFRDNWYADSGLIGATVALYAWCLSGKKLSELRNQYTKYCAIPETNFEVRDKQEVIDELGKHFSEGKQSRLDGISVHLPDGRWFNARPSNTESLLRLNAEAKTQSELDKLVDRILSIIKNT